MGDDLSPEAKAELLWRDYEQRRNSPPPSPPPPPPIPFEYKLIFWAVMIANAVGMGPEALTTILKVLAK